MFYIIGINPMSSTFYTRYNECKTTKTSKDTITQTSGTSCGNLSYNIIFDSNVNATL